MANEKLKGNEIATIDCTMVTFQGYEVDADELLVETSNKIAVTIGTETTDAVKLIIKNKLIAQKPQQTVVTGNTIVLTDNVFNDKLVVMLQGGTVTYEKDGKTFKKYVPPVAGSNVKPKIFKVNAYSAIYNAAGICTGYEKITYPNCQGVPIAFSSEDGVFRVSEYTIISAPNTGEAPYEIEIVSALPEVTV